jgi:hypothetical protein
VFDKVLEEWSEIGGKLAVAIHQRFENAAKVKTICEKIRLTNIDTHLLFSQVGENLGLVPPETVAHAFANLYAQYKTDRVDNLLRQFKEVLPSEE